MFIEATCVQRSPKKVNKRLITRDLGVLPDEICEWYLAVYVDAYEWIELLNTLGMSQFADGGMVASQVIFTT